MPADACPAIFVTGTDTGVGKTQVAAALASYLCGCGFRVGVMKPFETGVEDPNRPGSDALTLCQAAGVDDDPELIAPYRFRDPLAPALAAERAKATIDLDRVTSAFRTLRAGKDIMLVEGAGGLMVPVSGGFLMADLAGMLGTPLLVITHPRLGTLNHTLLTIMAARAMDLAVAGFIINRMPSAPDLAEAEAPHALASLASADLLGVLPEVSGGQETMTARLAEHIGRLPTLAWLMNGLGLPHP